MTNTHVSPAELPGIEPPAASWGKEVVSAGPELRRRIPARAGAEKEAVVVLGAGGAFAPELLNGLILQETGLVIGIDIHLTYRVDGVVYRHVDLCNEQAVRAFFLSLENVLRERGLELTTIYDLSTTQTSPNENANRGSLGVGKLLLLDILCEREHDVHYMFMSTAEVYGAPEGAPYREEHTKLPFNPYGRHKLKEEAQILEAHGRRTRGGALRTTALRCWTICMVNVSDDGTILSARNYNDPFIMIAQNLSAAGVRVPVAGSEYRAQFHLAEEVAEVCILLGNAASNAATWSGKAYNCIGRASTHEELSKVCFEVFSDASTSNPWWSFLARGLLKGGRLPKPLLAGFANALELAGGLLGARDLAGRLPFLYRSTDLDTSELQGLIGEKLTHPRGSSSIDAARRLALGFRNGGTHALNVRRYEMY